MPQVPIILLQLNAFPLSNQQRSLRTLTSGGLPLRGGSLRAWQASGLRVCVACICIVLLVVKCGLGVGLYASSFAEFGLEQEAGGEANSPKTQKPQRRQYGFGCRLVV